MASLIKWTLMGLLVASTAGCATKVEERSNTAVPISRPEVDHHQSDMEIAISYNQRGGILFIQGDWDGAVREFRDAIRFSPESAVPHNNLAMALYRQGHFTDARIEFFTAVRLNPHYAEAWNNLGFILFEQGYHASALDRWKLAIKVGPNLPSAWAGQAIGLLAFGYVVQAVQSYNQALRLDPRFSDFEYLQNGRHWGPHVMQRTGVLLGHLKLKPETYELHQGELRC